MKHTELYAALGLVSAATPHQIKLAWRRLAQSRHPDREGGDAEIFAKIQGAYDVLSDPERRAKYDATGETAVRDVDNEMLQELAALFFAVIDHAHDIDTLDVVKEVRSHLERGVEAVGSERHTCEEKLRKVESAQKRLKHKGAGRNVLSGMLDASVRDIRRAMETCDTKIKKLEAMREVLEAYTYAHDAPSPRNNDPYAGLVNAMAQGFYNPPKYSPPRR